MLFSCVVVVSCASLVDCCYMLCCLLLLIVACFRVWLRIGFSCLFVVVVLLCVVCGLSCVIVVLVWF